jgi:predicted amidophosphoribosyltransferase
MRIVVASRSFPGRAVTSHLSWWRRTLTEMACVVCGGPSKAAAVCAHCCAALRPAPSQWVAGVLVHSAFIHDGPARMLVHRLKYRASAVPGIGVVLRSLLPDDTTALVPVPRVLARRWRYGVDPALEIASAIGMVTGLPVVPALQAPPWVHRRAGGAGSVRGHPRFRRVAPVPPRAVLVDDVVTTGTTLGAAAAATGITVAVTVTAAARDREPRHFQPRGDTMWS